VNPSKIHYRGTRTSKSYKLRNGIHCPEKGYTLLNNGNQEGQRDPRALAALREGVDASRRGKEPGEAASYSFEGRIDNKPQGLHPPHQPEQFRGLSRNKTGEPVCGIEGGKKADRPAPEGRKEIQRTEAANRAVTGCGMVRILKGQRSPKKASSCPLSLAEEKNLSEGRRLGKGLLQEAGGQHEGKQEKSGLFYVKNPERPKREAEKKRKEKKINQLKRKNDLGSGESVTNKQCHQFSLRRLIGGEGIT